MLAGLFDLAGLYQELDAKREQVGLSWAALSREVGVSASTIKRLKTATDAEADGVLALIRWLGVAPEEFIKGALTSKPLPPSGAHVRVDMAAVAKACGDSRPLKTTRTTIQRLAGVALQAQVTIASLSRVTEI